MLVKCFKKSVPHPFTLSVTFDHPEMILQMRGPFPFNENRCIKIPSKEDIQRAFEHCDSKIIVTVQSVIYERNFNHLRSSVKSINHLLEEEEVYVLFGSIDQAVFALGLIGGINVQIHRAGITGDCVSSCGFRFVIHPLETSVRAEYRTIGNLLKSMRDVDQRLRLIGAVPSELGVPVLPSNLVHNADFDSSVRDMQEGGVHVKEDLHAFLVSKIRVDKVKRTDELSILVDKRIQLLISLQRIDKDLCPFSHELQFIV